jgi:RNA polymerase sigma-70 factor (ECF subfamily)
MPNAVNHTSGNSALEKPAEACSDEELMIAYSGGKTDAFNELFSRYKQPLYGFFRRRIAEPAQAQAEELTQETFLAVLRGSARYQPNALFRTYLYAIGFKVLRSNRRKVAFRAAFLGTSDKDREPEAQNSILADVVVRQAVSKLDPSDREVLLLREFEQLSYAEIAELLSLPVNTIRSRLFRARMALRELLSTRVHQPTVAGLAEFEERI